MLVFILVASLTVGVLVVWALYSKRTWARTVVVIVLLGMIGGSSFLFTEVAMRTRRGQAETDENISDSHLEGMAAMMRDAQTARVPILAAVAGLAFLAISRRL